MLSDEELLKKISGCCLPVLSLIFDYLGLKSGEYLAQAFVAIPSNVTTLCLGSNCLGLRSAAELAKAFAAIPPSVATLDLHSNFLCHLSLAEFAQVLAAIPAEVKKVNLSDNGLSKLGLVREVGDLLLKTAKNIIIEDDDEFSKNLRRYINEKPIITICLSVNSKQCKFTSLTHNDAKNLYGFFNKAQHEEQDLPRELKAHIISFLPRAYSQ